MTTTQGTENVENGKCGLAHFACLSGAPRGPTRRRFQHSSVILMRLRSHKISVILAACVAALCGCSSNPPPSTSVSRDISVAEIRDHGVIGLLGKPLGTMVTVTGVAVPNRSRRKVDVSEALFLKITAVDG